MAYTEIDDPSAYFQSVLWQGNGSSGRAITLDGNSDLQPDLVWFKDRTDTEANKLFDSVRGATKSVRSQDASAEATNTEDLQAFSSDGFTVGSNGSVNKSNGDRYVAWNWKAGTSFTNDASSTGIGATDSAGSVNETAGFSICTYTGVGGTSTTIKHGLSTAPTVMLIKNRDQDDDWAVYHQGIGNTHRLYLNNTDAATDAIGTFRDTSPTSSIFTVGDHASVNISGEKYVAYIFAEKQGYSKFGSYTGNGNNGDGPFIYTGFKPAFCLVKRTTSGENWLILDNKRDSFNPQDSSIYPNLNNAEDADGADYFDFVSNGMKVKTNNGGTNTSGVDYVYLAFAENPLVTSTGVPTTAR